MKLKKNNTLSKKAKKKLDWGEDKTIRTTAGYTQFCCKFK